MNFGDTTSKYLKIFYILGLSPFYPNNSHFIVIPYAVIASKSLAIMQTVICIGFCVSCEIHLNGENHASNAFGRTDIIMTNMFILCDGARAIFVLVQCLFYKNLLTEIIASFRRLEMYFLSQLDYNIPYSILSRRYFWKVFFAIIGYLQYVATFFIRGAFNPRIPVVTNQMKIFQTVAICTFLHVLFYIEALSFHLEQLIRVISRDIGKDDIATNIVFVGKDIVWKILIRSRLKSYKNVHLRLWELSQRINGYFGWCMLALLLQSFVGLVYTIYWFIGHLHHSWTWILLLRKKIPNWKALVMNV